MKTLQELYNEIIGSEDLKAAFAEAAKSGKTAEFLKAQGCEATQEELKTFLKSQTGELSDEELDNASGGGCSDTVLFEATISSLTIGVVCAITAIDSAATGYVGQRKEGDGNLCNG
jgi:hypothetical protein